MVSSFVNSIGLSHFFKSYNRRMEGLGSFFIFLYLSIRGLFVSPYRGEEFIKHLYYVGNKSIGIILLTGLFTGLALTYQTWLGFKIIGATNLVGPTVALGISRELGPVLTGLIVAARAGGAMAAQLGTMKVTEQIDALKVMAVNPIQYLVSPRVIASVLSLPILCALFDFIAMVGSYFLSTRVLDIDAAIFWDKITLWIKMTDVLEGLLKASIFGFCFSVICCYRGYNTVGGARGVGDSTNQGVVASMVSIIIIDYVATNYIRFFLSLGL